MISMCWSRSWLHLLALVTVCIVLFTSEVVGTHEVEVELDDDTYVAAALQWTPYGSASDPAADVIASTLQHFTTQVQQAKSQGVQILALPEGGLGMFNADKIGTRDGLLPYCETFPNPPFSVHVPNSDSDLNVHHFAARSSINPCMGQGGNWTTTSQAYIVSCVAQKQQMILVINSCDVQPCSSNNDPHCPADGRYQYNTQVVFNEHGDVVAKYHKTHLFSGDTLFDPSAPVAVTFSTSLGVTFGTFICFDILYPQPAVTLVNMGITHFIFSTWWDNFAPGYVATMQQQAFSRQYQVAMIAANSGSAPKVSGGGIFVNGEPLVQLFITDEPQGTNVRQLLVAKIPIHVPRVKNPPQHMHIPVVPSSPSLSSPSSVPVSAICALGSPFSPTGNCSLIELSSIGQYTLTVTSGTLTCQVTFTTTHVTNETYGLFACQGDIRFPHIQPLDLEICGISRCDNAGIIFGYTVCEPLYSSNTIISSFTVTGTGFSTNTSIFPALALDKSQVVDTMMLGYQQHHNGTRIAIIENGQTIKQTFYSALLFGVVP